MSKKLAKELHRRMRDMDDPRRYLVYSRIGDSLDARPWRLYYDVTSNTFSGEKEYGTRFKSKRVALAVADVLDDNYRKCRRFMVQSFLRPDAADTKAYFKKKHYFVARIILKKEIQVLKWDVTVRQ